MTPERVDCEVLGSARHVLAETPVWCARSACLWWVDVRGPALHRWNSTTGSVDRWDLPQVVGGMVVAADGGAIVALREALFRVDIGSGALAPLATLETGLPNNRLNELKTDPRGRLWCGSMWDYGASTSGSLYRVDASGQAHCVRSQVTIPNGMAFAPDGRTMFFVDTARGAIEAADYDLDAGLPGAWREWSAAGLAPGRPDGNAVDADGCVWSARFGAGCLARFTPDGRLDRLIGLPASQPTSCAFGGAELDTLFVTTGLQRLSAAALAAEPMAGAVLALRPGVKGLPVAPAAL